MAPAVPGPSAGEAGAETVQILGADGVEGLQGFVQSHAEEPAFVGLDVDADVGAERDHAVSAGPPVLDHTGQC